MHDGRGSSAETLGSNYPKVDPEPLAAMSQNLLKSAKYVYIRAAHFHFYFNIFFENIAKNHRKWLGFVSTFSTCRNPSLIFSNGI